VARSTGHWVALGAAGAALLALGLAATVLSPSPAGHGTHEQLGLPACTAMERLGIPCPGCGVTTSAALTLRGELAQAFRTQPFGLVVVVLGLLWIPWAAGSHLLGRDLGPDLARLARRPVLIALGAALAAAWLYKLWITLA
jgi:hypothetical protein